MKYKGQTWLLVFCCLVFLVPSASAALQAWLDRDRVAAGDSVELTLQHDGRAGGEPDLTPLRRDFDILGKASGTSVQIVNGSMSAQAQLRLTLAPKHSGRISVPALTWAGERSPALVLEVGGGHAGVGGMASDDRNAQADAGQQAHVFLSNSLETRQPYLQAATLLKLRLYTDQPLYQASLTLAASNDLVVQQLGKDQQRSETRGGRRYQVIERDYLLFPQRSGRISLPGAVLDAQVPDARAGDPFGGVFNMPFGAPFAGMMGATRPLRLHGDPIVLDVRPRPAGAATGDWLPARDVTLEESWRPTSGEIHAGEPITRHLSLSALGLSAAQLPDLAARMPLPAGIKAYPDQARLDNAEMDAGIRGSREQDVALIASHPGRYTFPAMRLNWWDVVRNAPQEIVLPARTLEILPAVAGEAGNSTASVPGPRTPDADAPAAVTPSAPSMPAAPASGGFPWPWFSLILALLWLATLAAWWRARRGGASGAAKDDVVAAAVDLSDGAGARKAFRQACRANDAAAARRNLLIWARANWPRDPPPGLAALAKRLAGPVLPGLLRDLDRACYAGAAWRGEALAEALSELPQAASPGAGAPARLAGLYP